MHEKGVGEVMMMVPRRIDQTRIDSGSGSTDRQGSKSCKYGGDIGERGIIVLESRRLQVGMEAGLVGIHEGALINRVKASIAMGGTHIDRSLVEAGRGGG